MKFINILVLILTISCSNKKEIASTPQITGTWRLSEVISSSNKNTEVDELTKKMLGRMLLSKGLILHFFPDSTFTELSDYSTRTGNWKYLNNKQVNYGTYLMTIDKIESLQSKKFLIANFDSEEDNIHLKLKFVEDGQTLKDFKLDPFYPANNTWRIRPKQKESNDEIRVRLLNYILHYANILSASLEREEGSVSFAHSLGLIQIFRGGIGRIPKNKINKAWINCFYHEEDAMKAFYLFSSYLKNGAYKGGSTGNWVKDDYEILMTLYYEIKNKTKEADERFAKTEGLNKNYN